MKKRIISVVIAAILVVFPFKVFAQVEETTLPDTLTSENIKISDKTYKENDDQVTLYLFRGQGCSHCEELLNYLNSIIPKYKDKFKLRAYEVWYNEDNRALQEKVAKKLNVDAEGVPFLIIGKQTFYGFQESDKSKIVKAIEKEYSSKERYDIIKEVKSNKKAKKNDALFIIIPVLIIGVILFLTRSSEDDETVKVEKDSKEKVEAKTTDVKKTVKAQKSETEEKPKDEVKKTTTKKATTKKSTSKKVTSTKTQSKAKTTKKTTKAKK